MEQCYAFPCQSAILSDLACISLIYKCIKTGGHIWNGIGFQSKFTGLMTAGGKAHQTIVSYTELVACPKGTHTTECSPN